MLFKNKNILMKKSGGVLLAALAGAIIVIAAVALNHMFDVELFEEENEDYASHLYGYEYDDDDSHGIEYLAMS